MEKTISDTYHELFISWQRSGLSKAAFACREGISKASFYYWSRKFENGLPSGIPQAGFSRIEVADLLRRRVARINYPSGISVELFGSVDADRIKALVF
jgi:hypothetical protein